MKNVLLVVLSIALSFLSAEAAVRLIDGYELGEIALKDAPRATSIPDAVLDSVPRAAGVERAWFRADPAPLANRKPVPADWQALFRSAEARGGPFRASDLFKAWNSALGGGDPCRHWFLRLAPGRLTVYDPADGRPVPRFRYPPDVTLPIGLVTNQIGWRGAPIENPREPATVRIVFVGSSTVQDSPYGRFSWPEFVGAFLGRWAEAKGLGLRFEVLNAGRESIDSTDIAGIVRTEVVPLRPDLVVYYEGGNQFDLRTVVPQLSQDSLARADPAPAVPAWLEGMARVSALAARVKGTLSAQGDGREPPKPGYEVVWPQGLDERDPDLSDPRLPVNLGTILGDLERIRGDLAAVGADFVLSSFTWFARDGMVLDPVRHRYILEQLNGPGHPFRYRDIARLAAFQNRVFAKYAAQHGLGFVDIAGATPFDPELFWDAVHTTWIGTRVRGWVAFNLLLPLIEKHVADGTWPRPWPAGASTALPSFTPRQITFDCGRRPAADQAQRAGAIDKAATRESP